MNKRKRNNWSWAGIVPALLVCLAAWADSRLEMTGRNIIEADAGGGNLLAAGKGESLIYASWIRRFPFPTSAVILKAESTSSSDGGYLVVRGLNSSFESATDSALIAGTSVVTLPGSWRRVEWVAFHDDSTNVGQISLYHGTRDADSTLAIIRARQGRLDLPVHTLPEGRSQVVPLLWGISAVTVAPESTASGAMALLAREPGGAWYVLDELLFRANIGAVEKHYGYDPNTNWETRWDLPTHTDLEVAVGVTSASIDARFWLKGGER